MAPIDPVTKTCKYIYEQNVPIDTNVTTFILCGPWLLHIVCGNMLLFVPFGFPIIPEISWPKIVVELVMSLAVIGNSK